MKQPIKRFQTTKSWGLLIEAFYLIYPPTRAKINRIIEELLQKTKNYPQQRIFAMTVGYSLSGKTHLVSHHPVLSKFFQVSSRKIHDLLNGKFPLLQDDKTTTGPGYWPRRRLTHRIRNKVFSEACRRGIAIASDSCNHLKQERRGRLRIPERHGYRSIIVWVKCDEETLQKRLQAADERLVTRGEKPTWVALNKKQKAGFQPPTADEVDKLLIYYSGKVGSEEILI